MPKLHFSITNVLAVTMLIAVSLAAFVWLNRPDPPILVRADKSSGGPVIAIFRHAGNVVESEYHAPYVEFAAWNDGTVIWRGNANRHDSKLLTANVGPEAVDKLFEKLSVARLLDPDLRWQQLGPGSGYVSIEIATSQHKIELASWHEGFEQSPNLICTDFGAEAMEPGQTKQDYIDEWSRAYRLFRTNWAIIRDESSKMIESDGTLLTGEPPKRTGGLRQNAG